MKKLKRIFAVIIAVMMILSFASCKGNDTGTTTATQPGETKAPQIDVIIPSADYESKIRVASTNDILGLVTAKIRTDKSYACEIPGDCADFNEVAAKLKNSQADIGVLPLHMAADLYKETNGAVKIIAATSGNSLQVITKDENVSSLSSLRGKKVYSAVSGTYEEDIVKYVFGKSGVDFDSVIVSDGLTYNEIVTKAIAGEIETCILPEPYASKVTLTNEKYKSVVSLNDVYETKSGATALQGCFVARTEYIESNPDLVYEFMSFCEIFTNYYLNFTEGAAIELYAHNYFSSESLAYGTIVNGNYFYAEGEALTSLVNDNLKVIGISDLKAADLCHVKQ